MATNVRNRSVGMLILSLGPTIFAPTILSRTGSETVALSPWRRRVLRMRFRSHILALSYFRTEIGIPLFLKMLRWISKLAAQVGSGRLRGALQVEGRDEATLLVHQIGDGGVVHGIAAAVERHLLEVDAIRLGHRRDRAQIAGESRHMGVEAAQIVLEHALVVALRIDGAEDRPVAVGSVPRRGRVQRNRDQRRA